jgi:hypothetical protein
VIDNPHYYLHAYKYFYRNPVHAGLCTRVEEYPYSTLRGLVGLAHTLIPVAEDETLFSDVHGTLEWLNKKPNENSWIDVGNALRKSKFKLCKDPPTNYQNKLEIDML